MMHSARRMLSHQFRGCKSEGEQAWDPSLRSGGRLVCLAEISKELHASDTSGL